jgi:hypothetical protein
VVLAAVADVAAVVVFVVAGRRSHAEAGGVAGVVRTAAPFVLGAGLGWVLGRVWRRPVAVAAAGLPVWVAAVAAGMALRRWAFDEGTAISFVIVTTAVLGVLVVGWRLAAAALRRTRSPV